MLALETNSFTILASALLFAPFNINGFQEPFFWYNCWYLFFFMNGGVERVPGPDQTIAGLLRRNLERAKVQSQEFTRDTREKVGEALDRPPPREPSVYKPVFYGEFQAPKPLEAPQDRSMPVPLAKPNPGASKKSDRLMMQSFSIPGLPQPRSEREIEAVRRQSPSKQIDKGSSHSVTSADYSRIIEMNNRTI